MIPFFSNIKEKDVFICEYQKHLIKRILSHDTLIENERTIVNMMIPIFGEKHIKKLYFHEERTLEMPFWWKFENKNYSHIQKLIKKDIDVIKKHPYS